MTLRKRAHWKFREKKLDHTLCRTHFGRSYGPVTIQTTELMDLTLIILTFFNGLVHVS